MTINLKKTQLGIAIALILVGVITLVINIYSVYVLNMYASQIFPEALGKATFGSLLLKQQSIMVIALLTVVSGILLLRNSKNGWILSVAVSFVYALLSMMSYWNYANSSHQTQDNFNNFSILGLYVLSFLGIGSLLTSKTFRKHYKPINNDWIIIAVVIILLMVNYTITK